MFGDPVVGSRAKVLAAIKESGQPEFTVREIVRKLHAKADLVKADLARLQAAGYVRHLPEQGTTRDKWQAHPDLI